MVVSILASFWISRLTVFQIMGLSGKSANPLNMDILLSAKMRYMFWVKILLENRCFGCKFCWSFCVDVLGATCVGASASILWVQILFRIFRHCPCDISRTHAFFQNDSFRTLPRVPHTHAVRSEKLATRSKFWNRIRRQQSHTRFARATVAGLPGSNTPGTLYLSGFHANTNGTLL